MTTKLDDFTPRGTPLHPYDVFMLLKASPSTDIVEVVHSPSAEDEADYLRNRHKMGSTVVIDGKEYFQTTSVKPETDLIA